MTDTWCEVYNVASTWKGEVLVMSKWIRYDDEFKLQAARMVVEQGYSYREVSRRLGASQYSVRKWVLKLRAEGELAPADQPVPEAQDLELLRKEVRQLRMENEILKKAAAYFARESL